MQRQVLVAVVATSALFVGAAYATDTGPFEPDPPKPTAEVDSLTIIDRGCRGEVQLSAGSMGGGDNAYQGVVETASPSAELTAKVARTSPEDATVVTYRAVVQTLESSNESSTCKGEVAYRLEIDAPSGATGKRVAVYSNGQLAHCSGVADGPDPPDTGCHQLWEFAQKTPVGSNQTTATDP